MGIKESVNNTSIVHPPHVLIFPLPIQSAINMMLKLSEMLCLSGIHITFLNTEHNHERLSRYSNLEARLEKYSGFHFETIPDGLPDDNPRSCLEFKDLILSLKQTSEPYLKEMLISSGGGSSRPPFTCIIAEDLFYYVVDIANDIGVPVIPFASISPACLWVFLCTPMIIDAGEFGCQGIDLKRMVTSVQGMEGILRKCDLPYLGPGDHTNNQGWIDVLLEIQRLPQTNGLILNTFDDLDGTITLNHLRSHCPNIYCIGPVHQHYKNKLLEVAGEVKEKTSNYSNNLWEEDRSCLKWLDEQTPKSVIYVSLGSLGMRTKDKLLELWHGLINSEVMFLWAIRPGSVKGEISGDQELFIEHERSCIVDWVPQEQVLAHPSIGGFFTHSGWGSTMESINAGVPMICWPEYVDQQVTSRLVGKVWNIGVDMKDNDFDRKSVEKMVREVMVTRKLEFQKSAKQFSELARNSITKDGSSHGDMNRLVSDIKMFSISPPKQCEIYT